MSMITKIGLCFIMALLTATAGISAPVRCPTSGKAGFVCCSEDKKRDCTDNLEFVSNASKCTSGENPCCYCPEDVKITCDTTTHVWNQEDCDCVCKTEEPTDANGTGICGGDLEWDSENCQCACPDSATKEQECIKKAYATWDNTLCACECTQPSGEAPTGKVWSEEACDYVLTCDPDGSKQQACDQKNAEANKDLDDPIWALDEQCNMYCQGVCAEYEELDEINCVCHPISTVFEESTITDITPEVTVSPLDSITTTSGSDITTTSYMGTVGITTTSGNESVSTISYTGTAGITTTTLEGSPSTTTTAFEGSPSTTSAQEGSLSTTPTTTPAPESTSTTTTAFEGSPSTTTTPEGSGIKATPVSGDDATLNNEMTTSGR